MRLLVALILAVMMSTFSLAQTTAKTDCMECHGDNALTMERNGKEVSLFVDQNKFKNSVHSETECIDCHSGFDAESLPHKEGKDISRVDCAQCHETQDFNHSIHAAKKVECFSCHTKHEIQPAATMEKKSVDLCVSCHKSTVVQSYTKSVHYKRFSEGAKAPSCITCHNSTAHKVQSASFSKQQEEKLCSTCHKHSQSEFSQSIHKLAKGANTPGCVSCHGAHEVYNNKYSISSQSCLKCHLDKSNFSKNGKGELVEFVQNYQTSIHAKAGKNNQEAATCVDCHGNHMITGTEVTKSMTARQNIPNTCGSCHSGVLKGFKQSSHGNALSGGVKVAPNCIDCHGEHTIKAIERTSLSKVAEKDVCYQCHVKNPEVIKLVGNRSEDITSYEKSAHFIALKNGNENAAACSDCHGGHQMRNAGNIDANTNKKNVARTCGEAKGCHNTMLVEFNESVHGQAIAKGNLDAPTCTDCHGNHQILSRKDPKSMVASGKAIVKLCSSCHGDVKMNEKYGKSFAKATSYLESYHGLAVRGGSKFAADCASCHGSHNIKPSSDPTSSINQANLSKTCGSCHPGANITAQFKQVHLTGAKEESAILYWITNIYIVLIVSIIGGMLLHNLLDLVRKLQEKKRHKKEIEELKKQGKVYLRMSKNERIQHFIMLSSFISLVISGFGLKYPDAFWVEAIRSVLGDQAFELRGLSHRFFGIAMIAVSLYHAYYLAFTTRGRQMFVDFLPKLQDLKDVIVNVKYLLGVSKEKPQFDRFSYMEKAEYWALVWGVVIMSATGLMLMFNNFFLSFAPKIFLDAATLVHLYEAWLATLAIIVWHFYFVIFNPEVYPLNTAFIKGTLTEEEMKHEHPVELERIKRASEQDETEINEKRQEGK